MKHEMPVRQQKSLHVHPLIASQLRLSMFMRGLCKNLPAALAQLKILRRFVVLLTRSRARNAPRAILAGMPRLSRPTVALLLTMSVALTAAAVRPAIAATGGSPVEQDAGPWQPLLEDHGAPGWRGWLSAGFPAGWHVEHGVLSKEGSVEDLVTERPYANFELQLEWKIGKGGNSGIFYRGTREYDHIYWSGPEYQLLDDANAPDGHNRLTSAAAAYALYAAPAGVVRPYGQWNKTRIVVRGTHVEHWLNGRKVVDYELQSPDWKSKVAASKFAEYPHYGLAASGMIGLQGDHTGSLAIRQMRLRELP